MQDISFCRMLVGITSKPLEVFFDSLVAIIKPFLTWQPFDCFYGVFSKIALFNFMSIGNVYIASLVQLREAGQPAPPTRANHPTVPNLT